MNAIVSKPRTRQISELVDELVASYRDLPKIRHIDAGRLPNKDGIIEILQELFELLYPGYFGKQNLSSDIIEFHVSDLLASINKKLYEQVRSAFVHEAARSQTALPDADARARVIVHDFLTVLPSLREVLATDVQAAFDGDPAAVSPDEIIFSYPGFFAITVYRIAHELYIRSVPLIPRIMSEYAHAQTGIDINPGATIAEYFFIDHGTGVVIGETSHIGKHVKIYQGVTLGALSTRGGQKLRGVKRHPTIEDDVTIYSGASVLGGETVIGKGAVISGNVFVTKSVPPYTRVTVKNPELQYKDQKPQEFKQELPSDWVI